MYSWRAMMPSWSGLILPTRRYIRSRQVQKLSFGLPATSARPAMARWNACECRLGMPGSSGPLMRSAPSALALAWTWVKRPSGPTSSLTLLAHPLGNKARSAKKADIRSAPQGVFICIYIYRRLPAG
ncbi:hypothetical protein D3C80_1408420 [compost metagenome]